MYCNCKAIAAVIGTRDLLVVPDIKVTFDLLSGTDFIVEYQGKVLRFKVCKQGLYNFDTATELTNKKSVANYSAV